MLISAGRLGPANMAKSKGKKYEKGGRHREREEADGAIYTVLLQTGQLQNNIVRGHGNENDLI